MKASPRSCTRGANGNGLPSMKIVLLKSSTHIFFVCGALHVPDVASLFLDGDPLGIRGRATFFYSRPAFNTASEIKEANAGLLNTYRIYGLNLNVLLAAVLWFWFCFCFVPNIEHTPLPTRSFLARRLLRSCGQRTRLMTLSGAGRIAFVPSKGIPFVNTLCHRMGPKSLKKPSMDMSQPRKKSFGQPGAGQVSWKSEDEAFATSSCPPSLRASLRTPHV